MKQVRAGWVAALGALLGALVLGVAGASARISSTPLVTPVVSGGDVRAVAIAGHTAYLGGTFKYVGGKQVGSFVGLNATSGAQLAGWSIGTGTIDAAAPDGAGGWYVGGTFYFTAGSTTYEDAAHVKANGALDPDWAPEVDGSVYALAVSSSTVYIGGSFQDIGGTSRRNLAAVDASTGSLKSWNPAADGSVYALAVSGSTVYAGGLFAHVNTSKSRSYAAAFDGTTGTATSWNPRPDSFVAGLAVSASTVYLGGAFTHVNGTTARSGAAAVTATTGTATSWNPQIVGSAVAIAVAGSTVYVGGAFGTVNGTTARSALAAFSASTGKATSWNPDVDGEVTALAVSGSTVYAGGVFRKVNGTASRDNIAAFDRTTGSATSFAPVVGGQVLALDVSGSTLFAAGDFASLGGARRSGLAAVDLATGKLSSFAPSVDSAVEALAVSGSTLYMGGTFFSVNGTTRLDLAAVDTSTGVLTPWNPEGSSDNFSGEVKALAVVGSTVYVGGGFQTIDGTSTRNNLAAVDATSGATTSWNPDLDGRALTLVPSGSLLYVGGDFTHVGADGHNYVAAVNRTTGKATSWDPAVDGEVATVALSGSTVYAGGSFLTANGSTSRVGAASFSASTGAVTSWNPHPAGSLTGLYVDGPTVYASGFFTGVNNSVVRNELASFDTVNGDATSWDPNLGAATDVFALAGTSSFLVAGGDFATVGGRNRHGLAAFQLGPLDGAGTMTTTTTSVANGSPGHALTFTYKAAGSGLEHGALTLTVPAGWSAPSAQPADAGYVTATVGTVSVSNSSIVVSNITRSAGQSLMVTYGSKAGGGPGATAPVTAGDQAWRTREKSTSGGTLTDLAAPPTVTVLSADGSGTLTGSATSVLHGSAGHSITFTYTAATGGTAKGALTFKVPTGWSAPSTSPTAAGYVTASTGTLSVTSRMITVTNLTLAASKKLLIVYGAKTGGGPGATAPTAKSTQSWPAKAKSSGAGALTGLAASPSVTVR